jgi:hypothetical protein
VAGGFDDSGVLASADGGVLVAGGANNDFVLASAEIFADI